ncbi:MAG TPA: phosphopentomutase [Pantanalinema sp.]
MAKLNRAFIVVLDGMGVGELPDAHLFGDQGANTFANCAEAVGGLSLPNLQKLGLGNIIPIKGVAPADKPLASFGKMAEKSPGKDTTTGHWEMAGVVLDHAFPVFPKFSDAIMAEFTRRTGRGYLGNMPASGTEILKDLGAEHVATGKWIVYTSGDSVFQIAAHQDVVPLDELYSACKIAREILDPHHVGRVIARPFYGEQGAYERNQGGRHDYSVPPPAKTLLDYAEAAGREVIGIGKISDIFAAHGVTKSLPTASNAEGLETTIRMAHEAPDGSLVFNNLVDTDAKYGHRNNPQGMAECLAEFDAELGKLVEALKPGDLLIISADHGNEATDVSTDHTREYVPLLAYMPGVPGVDLGTRTGFGDIAQTIAQGWSLTVQLEGESFWHRLSPNPVIA